MSILPAAMTRSGCLHTSLRGPLEAGKQAELPRQYLLEDEVSEYCARNRDVRGRNRRSMPLRLCQLHPHDAAYRLPLSMRAVSVRCAKAVEGEQLSPSEQRIERSSLFTLTCCMLACAHPALGDCATARAFVSCGPSRNDGSGAKRWQSDRHHTVFRCERGNRAQT